ncbi:hypothetical protein [Dactylosporangium darangshiense]|uniref:hypothetical protein n=1 Tax=Dactylosporangium darangshiense TaxID=579108 RepID=UPI00363034BE
MDTYLSLAAPDRRRPSPADIADLAAGGLRRHLRTAPGLGPGFRLAGLLALTTTSAFASGWAIFEALAPIVFRSRYTGPFMSLGVAAWAVWLLTAVVYVVAPGRWFRRLAVLAVLVTAGVVPAAMLTGIPRPPLIVLLPQLVLGIVAVGAATRHRRWVRLTPLAAAALTMPVTVAAELRLNFYGDYYLPAVTASPAAGVALLIGATLLALGLAARHDYRGVWALLILLTPIGMLALNPLGAMLDDAGPGRPSSRRGHPWPPLRHWSPRWDRHCCSWPSPQVVDAQQVAGRCPPRRPIAQPAAPRQIPRSPRHLSRTLVGGRRGHDNGG